MLPEKDALTMTTTCRQSHEQLAVKRKWAICRRLPPFCQLVVIVVLSIQAMALRFVKTLTELLPSLWSQILSMREAHGEEGALMQWSFRQAAC